MALLVFALGGLALGAAIALALRRHQGSDDDALVHGAASTLLMAFATWVATSWLLALAHALTAPFLVGVALAEFAGGVAWLRRLGAFGKGPEIVVSRWTGVAALVTLAPLAVWLAFVAWRGTVLPPYNHDALAYHLPKAVLLLKAHAFHVFDVPEARIASWPCNYELLLSDTMILTGSDHATAAVATVAYVAFLFATALVAWRAWGEGGAHVIAAVAITAAAPILILHSGLHKNDVLEAFFGIVAFVGAARWATRGSVASLVETTVALLLGIGTKVNGAIFMAVTAPFIVAGMLRHENTDRGRRVLVFVGGAAMASLVLGAMPYLANLVVFHRPVLPPEATGGTAYCWQNLWQITTMLVMRPFNGDAVFVWNPFQHERFWWPRNDVWMSDFGAGGAVLMLLVAPCAVVFRKAGPWTERSAASVAALAAYVLTLPISFHPRNGGLARYVVFVLPFLAAWTVCPLLLTVRRRAARWAAMFDLSACLGGSATFAASAFSYGVNDAYAPLGWLEFVVQHPESRVPFVRRNRAASVFDQNEGLKTSCAIDVGFDTWIYPAYGEGWTRDVRFLPRTAGPVSIPPDVAFVLVDRSWNVFFGHPGFVDVGDYRFLGRGQPSDADLVVYRQMRADPAFELVYDDRGQNQAIFRRRPPQDSAAAR